MPVFVRSETGVCWTQVLLHVQVAPKFDGPKSTSKMRSCDCRRNSCERSLSPQVAGSQAIEANLPCCRTKCPRNRSRQRACDGHSQLTCISPVSFAHSPPLRTHAGLATLPSDRLLG